jgi:large-conductance mechanosensitive channel
MNSVFFSIAVFTWGSFLDDFLLFLFSVTSILVIFVNMFKKSCDENARNAEAEKKKLEKAAIK